AAKSFDPAAATSRDRRQRGQRAREDRPRAAVGHSRRRSVPHSRVVVAALWRADTVDRARHAAACTGDVALFPDWCVHVPHHGIGPAVVVQQGGAICCGGVVRTLYDSVRAARALLLYATPATADVDRAGGVGYDR